MRGGLLFSETTPYGSSTVREVDKVFYFGRTKFQNVLIARSPTIGTFLALDNVIQSSEIDCHVYHEVLVHSSMLTVRNPKKALILGGGEGTTASELLRYKDVSIDWVEIDGEVVSLCKRYLPYALKRQDKRVNLVIGDAIDFVYKAKDKYDVIFGDLIDPYQVPIATDVYSERFARQISKILTKDGVYVTLGWDLKKSGWDYSQMPVYLKKVFPVVRAMNFYMPGFSMVFTLIIASKDRDPKSISPEEISKRVAGLDGRLKYYNPHEHLALFSMYDKTPGLHP
jgi:spermidine synthase